MYRLNIIMITDIFVRVKLCVCASKGDNVSSWMHNSGGPSSVMMGKQRQVNIDWNMTGK